MQNNDAIDSVPEVTFGRYLEWRVYKRSLWREKRDSCMCRRRNDEKKKEEEEEKKEKEKECF